MPRHLDLDDHGLTIELSGLLAVGALQRRIHVPWSAVKDVRAGASDAGRPRHGRFRRGRRVQFLSFEDPASVVRVEIDRSAPGAPPYDDVVVGAPTPGTLALELRRHATLALGALSSTAARAA